MSQARCRTASWCRCLQGRITQQGHWLISGSGAKVLSRVATFAMRGIKPCSRGRGGVALHRRERRRSHPAR